MSPALAPAAPPLPDPAATCDQPVTLTALFELVAEHDWAWVGHPGGYGGSELRAPDGHRFWLRLAGRQRYLRPVRDFRALACPPEKARAGEPERQ